MRKIKELKNKLLLTALYMGILLIFWALDVPCLFKHFLKVECIGCGNKVDASIKNNEKDSKSIGWWWLGFFFPIIGFILWAVWTGSAPIKAKRLLSGTIVGIVAAIVGVILYYVLFIILMFSIAY